MTESKKLPKLYWAVAIIAFVWNLMGVLSYVARQFMTEDDIKMLPSEQQDYLNTIPAWATAAFAIAVWFGLLGAIALLMRKKLAYPLFIISLLGIIVQQYYDFFVYDNAMAYGTVGIVQGLVVFIAAIFLIWYSRKCTAEGILK